MDWTAQVDGYCERTDLTFWSEPLNAITNAAFLIAAILVWPKARKDFLAGLLCLVLFLIGVGSFLFHTFATRWAGLSDVVPIAAFILVYVYAANRRFWNLSWPWALAGTALFVPYAAATIPIFQALPFFNISAAYWPVPMMIGAYGFALRNRIPRTARGLGIGAGMLVLSLVFRSLDEPLCQLVPMGTHLWWHILNGVMLAWMIVVLVRHRLEAETR